MLKKRKTYRFKRNVTNASPIRRRIMLRNAQRKISLRRRMFTLILAEEAIQSSEAS
ncbi:hypothetical protein [Pseudoalteromonas denitrificans]|uniref:Uncharacterized protein n=1 Tax=Pseudoalteromonas denitrificans DSM 6059 TaxID=1123010 RepID=A0A1I1SMS5_9GAMM|nr:hypothetical protein [Pseudoalteromonas denitrificans]SFD44330.1 hypothetical protein SAMN02745724_04538 [Pseudoalteromonas denitrificans DSM 6059]